MPDAKRTQLKKKIEAGEARNKARAEPTLIERTEFTSVHARSACSARISWYIVGTPDSDVTRWRPIAST